MIDPTKSPPLNSESTAMILYSPSDPKNSKISAKDRSRDASDAMVKKIVLSFICAKGFGIIAASWKLPPHEIYGYAVLGALIFPFMATLMNNGRADSTPISHTPPRKKKMSKLDALKLLNVPIEKANDSEFIDAQYTKLIQKLTPKINLGQSPFARRIDQLLEDIKQAYLIAKNK